MVTSTAEWTLQRKNIKFNQNPITRFIVIFGNNKFDFAEVFYWWQHILYLISVWDQIREEILIFNSSQFHKGWKDFGRTFHQFATVGQCVTWGQYRPLAVGHHNSMSSGRLCDNRQYRAGWIRVLEYNVNKNISNDSYNIDRHASLCIPNIPPEVGYRCCGYVDRLSCMYRCMVEPQKCLEGKQILKINEE
jgi:hypothetical protein